jgi:hypothetical protein
MTRLHAVSRAVALALGFAALSIAAAIPAHAAERLPDARILSAEPFKFRADTGIFSRMPAESSDSRIFTPRKTRPRGETQLSEGRPGHAVSI